MAYYSDYMRHGKPHGRHEAWELTEEKAPAQQRPHSVQTKQKKHRTSRSIAIKWSGTFRLLRQSQLPLPPTLVLVALLLLSPANATHIMNAVGP